MIDYYEQALDESPCPLVSIRTPSTREDWDGWKAMTDRLGSRVQYVEDDLFVTNPERLQRGISSGTANSLLVKVNQIGSLTETLDMALAQRNGYCMMSHRSGETEGDDRRPCRRDELRPDQERRPARSERVAKYSKALEDRGEVDDAAV